MQNSITQRHAARIIGIGARPIALNLDVVWRAYLAWREMSRRGCSCVAAGMAGQLNLGCQQPKAREKSWPASASLARSDVRAARSAHWRLRQGEKYFRRGTNLPASKRRLAPAFLSRCRRPRAPQRRRLTYRRRPAARGQPLGARLRREMVSTTASSKRRM